MNRRTTFALDDATIDRLKKLAAAWQVSQAEVVRKAVERAEKELDEQATDKIRSLRAYHERSGLSSDRADAYMDEVAENRSSWGRD